MGITIAYRGRIADLTRVEDFEDRLLDLALDVGGQAQIWRSHDDTDTARMVRGIILNVAPGQEPASLLLSPEGWLIGLMDIEDAERGRLPGPPWCFTKTQFGPLEGHIILVELLTVLRREFLPDLEVNDEGGYWETCDLAKLVRLRSLVQQGIEGLAEGLRRHGLSREAAEDPGILLKRIERIATLTHRALVRPAEHPPVAFPEHKAGGAADQEVAEALGDELFKHNRRQQERLQRALEERRARGEKDEEAVRNALDDLALEIPGEEPESADAPWREDEREPFAGPPDKRGPESDDADANDEEDDLLGVEKARPPLLESAMELLRRLHLAFRDAGPEFGPSLHTLFQGAGDAMGGLAQGLSRRVEDDPDMYGLRISQLKRALRGAVYACGALFPLRPLVPAEQFEEFQRTLRQLEQAIFQEIGRVRSEHPEGESWRGINPLAFNSTGWGHDEL